MTDTRYVYRLRDVDGALLYVGCSGDLKKRLSGHRTDKWWWPLVDSATAQGPFARLEGLRREREAIETETPRFNHQHNPNPPLPEPATWVAAAKRHAPALCVSYAQAFRLVATDLMPAFGPITDDYMDRWIASLPSSRQSYELSTAILARATDAVLRALPEDVAA